MAGAYAAVVAEHGHGVGRPRATTAAEDGRVAWCAEAVWAERADGSRQWEYVRPAYDTD